MLVFTETWLGEGQQPPDIAGYRAFNYSRPAALQTGHARGGLACYIRQELCGHVHHVTCDPTSSFAVLREQGGGFRAGSVLDCMLHSP